MSAYTTLFFFFFQAEAGIRDLYVTGVQTCALPISRRRTRRNQRRRGCGQGGRRERRDRRLRAPRGGARRAAGARRRPDREVLRRRRRPFLLLVSRRVDAPATPAPDLRRSPAGSGVFGGARRRARSVRRRRRVPATRCARSDRPQRLAELRSGAGGGSSSHRRLHRRQSFQRTSRMIDLVAQSHSQRVFDLEAQYLAPGTQSVALFSKLCMDRGEGAILWDVDGNRYVDLLAGVGVASLGYAHPRYVAEMTRQLERVHVGSFTSEHRAALVKLIAGLAPGDLNRTQLYSSGAEAVEAAVRLAKAATGRHEIMGFWGGFHGKTGGVLPLLSGSFKHGLGPLAPGAYSSPYASCARCAFGKTFPSCHWHCVDFVRSKIALETSNDIAAIIVEPVQGTAGNIVPPPGYLRELRALATEIGALLICDEMITGFGRTGKMFAVEH